MERRRRGPEISTDKLTALVMGGVGILAGAGTAYLRGLNAFPEGVGLALIFGVSFGAAGYYLGKGPSNR